MKNLLAFISIVFCLNSQATSITTYSVGISLADFSEQGGIVENVTSNTGVSYRINLNKFKNCVPNKVIAKVISNEKTLLSVELENNSGWYQFNVPLKLSSESSVLKVFCKKGIPLRNIWL